MTILIIVILVYFLIIFYLRSRNPEIHWDWDQIDENNLHFPEGFIWGTATAAHQVEGGCTNNNWSEWEQSVDDEGQPRIRNGDISGTACDHWNRYREDIQLMKELGVTSYRFSVEWSKIEPEAGQFDQSVIRHYSDVVDALLTSGIEPFITLYHFTHPIWFKKLGSFEKIENIDYFLRFCERVFSEYSDRVKKWCTINEIEVEASQGYFAGIWPPGKRDPAQMGVVIKNLLEAHVRVYHSLKNLAAGDRVEIGLVKNIFQFDPYRSWHLMDHVLGLILNYILNTAILNFFKTGKFRIYIPFLMNVSHTNPQAVSSNDFVGLNYYSHFTVKTRWNPKDFFELKIRASETPTDMDYSIYPEGFYRALLETAKLGYPIYVTENGIADRNDDRRELFIRRYLYALSRAIESNVDVRGYYYWSLMDNFEWAAGYDMKFGLYEVNFDTQERALRQGSKIYRDIINKS